MSRKAKTNGSTALAMVEPAPPVLQITRAEANARIKARALELYHAARTQRDEHIRAFEAEYGRADRIDHTVLAGLFSRIHATASQEIQTLKRQRFIRRLPCYLSDLVSGAGS